MGNIVRNFKKALKEPAYACRVIYKRMLSILSYYFLNGYSAWPETVSLFLTYRCNLRCRMCGYWGVCSSDQGNNAKEDLSLEFLKKAVDDVKSFRPNITLFGGEPLMYSEWPLLVSYIKKNKMRCNIVTNGTLLAGKEESLVDSGLDEVILSLEGPEEIHDKITQVPGSFKKVITSFEAIRKLKKDKLLNRPSVNICCTITEDNYRSLEEIISLAEELGASSVAFHHQCFITRDVHDKQRHVLSTYFQDYTDKWGGFIRGNAPDIDPEYLAEAISKIGKKFYKTDVFFYPGFTKNEIIAYYTKSDFVPLSYQKRCISPWITSYIFPDGAVGPCEEIDLSCGNIKEKDFKEIWNGALYRELRNIVKKEKFFPVCPKCTEFYRF